MAKETRYIDIRVTSNVDKSMNKGTKAATGLSGALSGVAGAAGAATGGIRAMTAALITSGVGAFVVAIGAAVQGLRSIISVSSDFEFQMDKLNAITAASTEEMELFKKEAIRLGSITQYTAEQVGQLQTEFAKLGFTTQEIINATDATLDLATAADVDLATAARVTGASLNAFGLDTVETTRLIDVMAKSFSSSALDMSKFDAGIAQAAASAKTMGISVEQTVSAMSVLNNAGIEGSKVGTDLRKIFGEISKTTGKDFRQSLDVLAESLDKANSKQEQMNILTDAVGERSKIALSILIDQRDKLDELTTSYENAGGAVADMAEIMRDNAKTGADLVKSAWQGMILAIEDGDGVIQKVVDGSLTFFADFLTAITDRINHFNTVGVTKFNNFFLNVKQSILEFQLTMIEASQAINDFFGFDEDPQTATMVANITAEIDALEKKMKGDLTQAYLDYQEKSTAAAKTEAGNREKVDQDLADASVEIDQDALDRKAANRQKFLDKLQKMEEDAEDLTEEMKIERKRERHLAELEKLEIDETEKGDLRYRINEYYNGLIAANNTAIELKNREEAKKTAEELAKEKKRAADEEMRLKKELLDSTAEIFGEETAMYKALHALKAALTIKELLLEAGIIKAKSTADAAETSQEGSKQIMKSAGNPLKMALTIATVAGIMATQIKAMRATKKAADDMAAKAGGSAGGGGGSLASLAPSFNVIGGTSAGENMIASRIDSMNQKPVKAYVVEGEVSDAQSLSRKVKASASF